MGEIKDLFKKGEQGLAKSLLKWKLSKEGKNVEGKEAEFDRAAGELVNAANSIIKKHGKNIVNEFKEAARELKDKGRNR